MADADFDIAGPVNTFIADSFIDGSIVADSIGLVMPRLGDFGANLTARNGNIGTVITTGDIGGQLDATNNINLILSRQGGFSGSAVAGNNIGTFMVNWDVSGKITANRNINMILAQGGDFTGAARAGSDIGTFIANNLDHALLSAGDNIRMVNIRHNILDSYILGGYDIGTDCAFDLQEPGGEDLLNNGNIGIVFAGGRFERSYIGAGVLPSGPLTSSLPSVGVPGSGVGGNIQLVSFSGIDANAGDNYGIFSSRSTGLSLVGGRLVGDNFDDYFRIHVVS